jgi:hypothetical protein
VRVRVVAVQHRLRDRLQMLLGDAPDAVLLPHGVSGAGDSRVDVEPVDLGHHHGGAIRASHDVIDGVRNRRHADQPLAVPTMS